ncbi:MAG TPA: M14 family zinc carboxypeptidase [Thermoanaerobaculia bacterium]|nr:M14 family zinc carboxypeptidase [Thermoanaerobaculia bacterium]
MAPDVPTPTTGDWSPDMPEPGSVEEIRRHTTGEEYLPESVSYVPYSATVPSPAEVLGHVAGAEGELSSVGEIHGYFRRLAEASPRVGLWTIGTSEEGREILLVAVSDEANLAGLERIGEINRRLADPRVTDRVAMRRLADEGKVVYHLLGGLHSTETGSPEMLMELAYRLAVSERPETRRIRGETVVLITPVVEVDGRDRIVEWYRRHLAHRADLPWEEVREIGSPPYWGHYAFHDNNRDGMQLALALTRAVNDVFHRYHPQVVHDLHESLPLLYISTGHGPYSEAIDPVTINEWTQLAHHEAGELQAQGLPGVWTWGFWDGWWPGYLFSVANNHNATGRFYETFGNSHAGTFERKLSEVRFVGVPVTESRWYRPWPPDEKVTWSLRNNTNYMQAGVLEALDYAARHREELLRNGWIKAERSLAKGRGEAPYAWVFPAEQRDPARLAYLVDQLRAQRIEVHRLDTDWSLPGAAGDEASDADEGARSDFPAGSVVVRMDQPYRNAAVNFLSAQEFPPDEPNPPYDDVAWTWPLLYGVEGERIDDEGVLAAAMSPLAGPAVPGGSVAGGSVDDGGDGVYLLADRGQNALLSARLLLGDHQVDAAGTAFRHDGVDYPAGSWVVLAPHREVERVAAATGLTFTASTSAPSVRRHLVDLPRVGVLHTWTSTQDAGWVRYTLDRQGLDYDLVNPDHLKAGAVAGRYDVLIFPNTWGDFARMVHGIDPKWGPLAYSRTAEFPSHGVPDSSPDITGGMGLVGLMELQRFVHGGGVLVAIGNAGTLAVDGGLVRRVDRLAPSTVRSPGSEVAARVVAAEHPIAYGYEERTSVFRGSGPIWDVDERDRSRVVLQFGDELPEEDEEGAGSAIEIEDIDTEPIPAPSGDGEEPAAGELDVVELPEGEGDSGIAASQDDEEAADEPEPRALVLSGWVAPADALAGKPAILDVPAGEGRVILFAFNPLHRYLNHSDFRLLFNTLLHWNDLP